MCKNRRRYSRERASSRSFNYQALGSHFHRAVPPDDNAAARQTSAVAFPSDATVCVITCFIFGSLIWFSHLWPRASSEAEGILCGGSLEIWELLHLGIWKFENFKSKFHNLEFDLLRAQPELAPVSKVGDDLATLVTLLALSPNLGMSGSETSTRPF